MVSWKNNALAIPLVQIKPLDANEETVEANEGTYIRAMQTESHYLTKHAVYVIMYICNSKYAINFVVKRCLSC